MLKPFKHQEKFASNYTGKNLLVHEAGTGKTICAILWLKDNRDSDALVVCPRRVVDKWRKTLKDWGTKATVLSKEEFKKTSIRQYSAVVIDECDWFASPLFAKGRSQLTVKMYELIKETNPQTLLLSATPIRSNPWNLHTLLTFSGHYVDWKKWREYFFELKKLPYLPRPAWIPKKDWRKLIRPTLEKYSDIVLMKDCVDFLPPETHEIVKVKSEKYIDKEWEGSKAFYDEHKHEQKNKAESILEIARQYRKVLVVAYYTEQISELQKKLSRDRETYVLQGGVKDQEKIIKDAYDSDECFFICQNSIGEGFDLDNFSAVIFASQSYAVRDYVQMKARVRRIHNLQPAIYYYLQAGQCDKQVYNNVMAGKDYVPSEYRK